MNKINFLLLLILANVSLMNAQNNILQITQNGSLCEYITNGDFETAQCCGVINNSISLVGNWSGTQYVNSNNNSFYTSTPDLFYNTNVLGFSSDLGIPNNFYGTQSDSILINGNYNVGNGYVGISAYSEPTGTYEGLKTVLIDTLRHGIKYLFRYYSASAEVATCASFLSAKLSSTSNSSMQGITGNTNFTEQDWKLRAYSFTAADNFDILEISGHSGLGLNPQPNPQVQDTTYPYFNSPWSGAGLDNYSYMYLDKISLKPLADLGPDIVSNTCHEQIHIISCMDPNYTYHWFKYDQLSNTWMSLPNTTNYLTVYSSANDSYKLEVTYQQDGYIFTGSDVIHISSTFCCTTSSPTTTLYGNYNSSSFPLANNGPGGTRLISNINLALNGNLTIDQNTVINASTLQLNSQCKIIVPNGKTLNIHNGSVLEGCTYRWAGIEVQAGGNIFIDGNSTLKDADYAVNIQNSSQATSTYYFSKVNFSRNYYSIKVSNLASNGNNIIEGCEFNCYTSLLPTTNLLTDTSQHYSFRGISFNACSAKIGTFTYPNKFHQTKIGVEALFCQNIEFRNNYFDNTIPPLEMQQGVYVRSSEVNFVDSNQFKGIKYGINSTGSVSSMYRNVRVRPTVNNSNRFLNCEYGIYIGYCMNAQIENNLFSNCSSKGVYSYRSKGLNSSGSTSSNGNTQLYPNNFYVKGNIFRDCLNSIELAYVSNANIEISKNNISHASQGNSTNLNEGIRYTNYENIPNNTSNTRCLIYLNNITDAYRGIVISGAGNSTVNAISGKFNCKVYDNIIKVRVWNYAQNPTYSETYAIFIQNCKKAEVVGSTIFSALTSNNISTWPSYATKGIRFDNSPLCFTSCNNLQNIGDNIWYRGSSISQVIQNNTFDNPYHAILLESDIGKQPIDGDINNKVQDNQWINMTSNATKTLNICTDVPLTVFYYRNAPSLGMNSSDLVLGNSCNNNTIGTVLPINNPSNSPAACLNINLKAENYLQFFENFNESYSSFTSNINSDELEKMYLSGIDFYKLLKYNPLIETFNSEFADYRAQMDSTDLATILNIQEQANWPLDSTLSDSLLSRLNTLNPMRESDIWKVKLYQVLLPHQELNEVLVFTENEISELKNIAEQCPYTCGEAVYESRALLRIYDNASIDYKNGCEEGYYEPNNSGARLGNSGSSVQIISADGPMEIQLDEIRSETGKEHFILYNSLGLEICKLAITKNQAKISLQNQYLQAGVYVLKSLDSMQTIKIIVS